MLFRAKKLSLVVPGSVVLCNFSHKVEKNLRLSYITSIVLRYGEGVECLLNESKRKEIVPKRSTPVTHSQSTRYRYPFAVVWMCWSHPIPKTVKCCCLQLVVDSRLCWGLCSVVRYCCWVHLDQHQSLRRSIRIQKYRDPHAMLYHGEEDSPVSLRLR